MRDPVLWRYSDELRPPRGRSVSTMRSSRIYASSGNMSSVAEMRPRRPLS